MESPTSPYHAWMGIESLADLDTARVRTLLSVAVADVEQTGGTITSIGLAPFVVPDDGAFVLVWLLSRAPASSAPDGSTVPPSPRPMPRGP